MLANSKWLESYNKLNNSFKKKLIFRLGADSGFFSEYNHMIFAMIYCLKHEIKFVLSSKKNNFGIKNGWQDFFLPFCKESKSSLHAEYNIRSWTARTTAIDVKASIFRRLLGAEFFTQHLWMNFRKQEEMENVSIPELELTGNLVENCHVIVNNIWRYQPDVAVAVKKTIVRLNLDDEYIGIHIRGGDKITEHKLFVPSDYIKKLKKVTSCKNVYVATDDYRNILTLRAEFPDYVFYTNCDVNTTGYLHSAFEAQNINYKRQAMLDLFTDIDVLSSAKAFIGTYSSNVGMYVGMRRGVSTCYCLDFDEWRIW